jgi:hypothetical protein
VTFRGASGSRAIGVWNVRNWRIDHAKFTGYQSGTAISAIGDNHGVVDHVQMIDVAGVGLDIEGYQPGDVLDGDAAWSRPLSLGSENAVFWEDSYSAHTDPALTFSGEHIASNRGSRYVVRHNTYYDTTDYFATPWDAHGKCNPGSRGSRSWEIYDNDVTHWVNGKGFACRGGDGVVFNNTFTVPIGVGFALTDYQTNASDCSSCGTCANMPPYPAPDQIRRGFFWNNTWNDAPLVPGIDPGNAWNIQINRDVFLHAPTAAEGIYYAPYPYPHPLVQLAPQ